MPDFTARGAFGKCPVVISNVGDTMLGDAARLGTGTASTSAWTTANNAQYCPFTVTMPFLAQKMGFRVSTQSGNIDVGIYDEKGNRLVSKGSTAVAAAGLQVVDITDTWLMPGTYFMAMNCDNTTAAFGSISTTSLPTALCRVCGIQTQAVGAVTLPNPATFATYAGVIPLLVVTGVATL